MSCENCEKQIDMALNKNIAETIPIAYYRWDNANIAILGCKKHVKEIIDFLNEARK